MEHKMQQFSMWQTTLRKLKSLHKLYCVKKEEKVFISWFLNEIIDKYSIDKEKCEWSEKKRLLYNTKCKKYYEGNTKSPDFIYCPYCGREITFK